MLYNEKFCENFSLHTAGVAQYKVEEAKYQQGLDEYTLKETKENLHKLQLRIKLKYINLKLKFSSEHKY